MLKIGDAVKFFRYETVDGKSDYVSYNAIVLGVRPDGKINLVCLNPGDLQHLQGAEWQLCMTRHFDIVPENSAGAAVDFYREAPETFATAHSATGDDKYDFPEIEEAKLPSDADLDAAAKEEEVKDSTAKTPAKVRVVKGSKGE